MPPISLNFENNYGMYIFAFLLLPVLFFYKTKIQSFSNINSLSLSQNISQQLQGLFIVTVILHHISQRMEVAGLMQVFHVVGDLAVGVFFFISGVGLSKSLKIKGNYLDGFLQKKIIRIFLPFLTINMLTIIILYLNGISFSTNILFQYLLGIKLIDGTLWFIQTIMLFYFFFYISFFKRNGLRSLVSITLLLLSYIIIDRLLGNGEWTYTSSLCFLLGIYYIYFEEQVHALILNRFYTLLFLSLLLFLASFILKEKIHFTIYITSFITPVFFVAFIFILFLKLKPMSFIFNFLGNISLEMYLLHIKILFIFSLFTTIDSGVWIVLYLASLALCSYLFSKFNTILHNKVLLVFNK